MHALAVPACNVTSKTDFAQQNHFEFRCHAVRWLTACSDFLSLPPSHSHSNSDMHLCELGHFLQLPDYRLSSLLYRPHIEQSRFSADPDKEKNRSSCSQTDLTLYSRGADVPITSRYSYSADWHCQLQCMELAYLILNSTVSRYELLDFMRSHFDFLHLTSATFMSCAKVSVYE